MGWLTSCWVCGWEGPLAKVVAIHLGVEEVSTYPECLLCRNDARWLARRNGIRHFRLVTE